MSIGPLMIDLRGLSIEEDELKWLQNPQVGGVILFSRNFESIEQLTELVSQIHSLRSPPLLVSVDHEGGRVQRFREGFTILPAVAEFGKLYAENKKRARHLAEETGWLMASELRAVGIDFSFAPVLDLDLGVSEVIGDRAFHRDPDVVSDLALNFIHGMKRAGMATVGKHFPGHGAVELDSHLDLPVDTRSLEDIRQQDLLPFQRLFTNGLDAVMPAHILYRNIDAEPAGFSPFWLQKILREEMQFSGAIFSDDLSMGGATGVGAMNERVDKALKAGCDMVLICNSPETIPTVLQGLKREESPIRQGHLARMHGRHHIRWQQLYDSPHWHQVRHALIQLSLLSTDDFHLQES